LRDSIQFIYVQKLRPITKLAQVVQRRRRRGRRRRRRRRRRSKG
jgi:hypothetical protein